MVASGDSQPVTDRMWLGRGPGEGTEKWVRAIATWRKMIGNGLYIGIESIHKSRLKQLPY